MYLEEDVAAALARAIWIYGMQECTYGRSFFSPLVSLVSLASLLMTFVSNGILSRIVGKLAVGNVNAGLLLYGDERPPVKRSFVVA
jgi:hypothetical protein